MNKYNIIHLDVVDSTNNYLKENYQNTLEYTIVYADSQTNGKGRMGRKWISSGKNLEFSILLKPKFENISLLSLLFGLAVSNTIDKYVKSEIKWPNDIIVCDKKICGMLAESIVSDKIEAYIMGIGININEDVFEDELSTKATSLKLLLNKDFDIKEILDEFIINFDILYKKYLNKDYSFLKEVRRKNYLLNKQGYIQDKLVKVIDIDDSGNLVVIDALNTEHHLYSGEFSPSNEYSGLIFFRMDWLDILAVQGTLKSLLQHHTSKASFFTAQLSL